MGTDVSPHRRRLFRFAEVICSNSLSSVSDEGVSIHLNIYEGLWEQLSDETAVDIVFRNPELVVRAALQEVTKKREMRYGDIRKIEKGIRRHFHDDSTVVCTTARTVTLKSSKQGIRCQVDIVFRNPELVIRAALQEVTKKREMRYGDIKKIGKGIRRHFHDESTVVVIYLDQHRGFIIVEMPPYFYFE
ncbi:hypothetical protein V6N13_072675 [Hibiscus sabdariffa]